MALLVFIGVVVVLVGMIACTKRAEDYWSNRRKKITLPQRIKPEVPPFVWSATQCIDCGKDGELLNLEKRCGVCHEMHYASG